MANKHSGLDNVDQATQSFVIIILLLISVSVPDFCASDTDCLHVC